MLWHGVPVVDGELLHGVHHHLLAYLRLLTLHVLLRQRRGLTLELLCWLRAQLAGRAWLLLELWREHHAILLVREGRMLLHLLHLLLHQEHLLGADGGLVAGVHPELLLLAMRLDHLRGHLTDTLGSWLVAKGMAHKLLW